MNDQKQENSSFLNMIMVEKRDSWKHGFQFLQVLNHTETMERFHYVILHAALIFNIFNIKPLYQNKIQWNTLQLEEIIPTKHIKTN